MKKKVARLLAVIMVIAMVNNSIHGMRIRRQYSKHIKHTVSICRQYTSQFRKYLMRQPVPKAS
jgi:hypothetical protein